MILIFLIKNLNALFLPKTAIALDSIFRGKGGGEREGERQRQNVFLLWGANNLEWILHLSVLFSI